MEVTKQQREKIIKLLDQGERNRNTILFMVIKDDEVLKILALYKHKFNSSQIYSEINKGGKEKNISYDRVDEIIKYIDDISRFIDSRITRIKNETFNEKHKNEEKERAYLRKMSKKDKLEKNLQEYKKKFYNKEIGVSNLSKNMDKLIKIIEILGNKTDDVSFLVQALIKLEKFEKAEEVLNEEILNTELDKYAKTVYEMRKRDLIKARVASKVSNMYSLGFTPEEIYCNLERNLTAEDRRSVNMKLINDMIKICNKKEHNKINGENKEINPKEHNSVESEER